MNKDILSSKMYKIIIVSQLVVISYKRMSSSTKLASIKLHISKNSLIPCDNYLMAIQDSFMFFILFYLFWLGD